LSAVQVDATARLMEALRTAHSGLKAEQMGVLHEAAQSLSGRLQENGVCPVEFFTREFDARSFLKARKYLLADGEVEPGISDTDVNHAAAAVVSIFGSEWKPWLDQMAKSGATGMESASCLPLRAVLDRAGLSEFLKDGANPARAQGNHYDHNDL